MKDLDCRSRVAMLEESVGPEGQGTEGKIFEQYRTLGNVSTGVPCFLRYIHTRNQNFIVTCNGKSFNTYVGQKLKLISVGGTCSSNISCITGDTFHVYTGVGKTIYAWRRGTELKHKYEGHKADVKLLLAFGPHLISLDEEGQMYVWDIQTEEIKKEVKYKTNGFDPTVMMHPLTFENKIMIGSSQGMIQLWNIQSGAMIYHFTHCSGSRINAIVQSPGQGVVAVALACKSVLLLNFQYDVIIMTLECIDEPLSITFRFDDVPVIMAGSTVGSITVWDLNQRQIIFHDKAAHGKAVTGLVSFMGEPIMVSSSADNCVNVWIFDKPDGGFRLLNSRNGHQLPPTMVSFHGDKELNIISTGEDKCLRSFHIHNETINRIINNYQPGSSDKKVRGVPTTQFAIGPKSNYGGWEDIACFDKNNGESVHTFSIENAKRGIDLKMPKFHGKFVTCVHITSCNQFTVVGFKTGEVTLFNLQSKLMRHSYKDGVKAHRQEITGLVVDTTNSVTVSGSVDKCIKFWNFGDGKLISTLNCDTSVEKIFCTQGSNLFGVVLSNFVTLVCDINTLGVIRKLEECSHPVLAAAFSPDCKWITAATSDGCVRTWDVPTANLVDIFRMSNTMVTSLAYSPSGEFLATTLSGELGIVLWMNKTMYQHVSLLPLPSDYESWISSGIPDTTSKVPICMQKEDVIADESFDSLQDTLYDLTVLVRKKDSRWKQLLKLQNIEDRNKPKVPTNQEMAPFMFSTLLSDPLVKERDQSTLDVEIDAPPTKILKMELSTTPFFDQLSSDSQDPSHYEELINILEEMGPSKVDSEIRSLGPENGGSISILKKFIEFIIYMVKSNSHFETVQAFLGLFLKVYSEIIPTNKSLASALDDLYPLLKATNSKLINQIIKIIALTDFAKSDLL